MMRISAISALILVALASPAWAKVVTQDVEYTQDGTVLEGFMAYDDAISGRRPGVLVVHQWTGLTDYEKMRARMLAELGYVAFAADIYGKGVRAEGTEEAAEISSKYRNDRALLRKRVNAALEVLKGNAMVDPSLTAAIGYCFGGMTVLELARSGADIRAAVTFHGVLDTPDPADARNIRAKVLALHGAADEAVPPAQVAAFQKEMSDAGVDWYMVTYAYARHAFTQKGPRYNEPADRRSWEEMKTFLTEALGR